MTKRRTREHIIADLSINHVEKFILHKGHVADRVIYDYGYDLIVRTFDSSGYIERGCLFVQLKASDAPEYVEQKQFISVRLDPRDTKAWQEELFPVLLIFYDAAADCAYWQHFQSLTLNTSSRVRIPTNQKVDNDSVEKMRILKNEIVARHSL